MQDTQLAADINQVARLKGSFRLRSGMIASEYFDKYRFESEPALLQRIAQAMIRLIPAGTEVLAGLELGGVPLATAMSLQCGLPTVFVRKVAKDYGTCQAIEGRDVGGVRLAIVEDVISTGGAVVQAARLLEDAGATLTGVVCAIWRPQAAPSIAGLAAPVFAALTARDLG
ncbi:MAG TPA: orotate phosphoribosyltransferase [Rhizomicrobium sp.]|jgi:orotate phosphoribosyltransferase|nr:orotate phosphoribosyltransferase [Rhizomicrobium sp.]